MLIQAKKGLLGSLGQIKGKKNKMQKRFFNFHFLPKDPFSPLFSHIFFNQLYFLTQRKEGGRLDSIFVGFTFYEVSEILRLRFRQVLRLLSLLGMCQSLVRVLLLVVLLVAERQ